VSAAGVTVPSWYVNVAVLVGAIGFETYAPVKANAELRSRIDQFGWSGLREAFRTPSDVTTLTAFTEDTIVLLGAGLALVGPAVDGDRHRGFRRDQRAAHRAAPDGPRVRPRQENKRLLLGERFPADVEADLRDAVRETPGVIHINTFRTVFVGPQEAMVTTDVRFEPGIEASDLDAAVSGIEDRLREADERVKYVFVDPET
jgi:hypothetical protein